MIKRLLWLVVALVCVVRSANAQQGLQGYVVTGTGAQARIVLIGSAIVFHQLTWNVTGTVSGCTVALDTSADGVSWSAGNAIAGQTCTSNGQSALSSSAVFNFVRVNTTAFSGTGSVVITWAGYVATPGGLPSGCTSPGMGAITCTGTVAANALTSTTSLSTGSGASAAGATATGGFACVEAASTGWTSTAGQIYIRCDLATNALDCGINGAADGGCTFGPLIAPTFTSNGTTAGFVDYPQGSTSAAVAPCNTANSWCVQAAAAMTAGVETMLGVHAQGVNAGTGSSSAIQDVNSGDAGHSAVVTIGSGADIAATSLCSTANCPVGTYAVSIYIDMTTPCGTTGTFIAWLGYTDDSGARTGSSTTTFFDIQGTGSVPSTGTLTTTSTVNFGQATYILRTTGAATGGLGSINYGATRTACGTAGPMVGKMYLNVVPLG